MPVMPSGTVTFLFTDIEGSTRRWDQHRQQVQAAFSQQEDILRRAIDDNGGYAYKQIGDAFQAAFPTAPQAAKAALDAQRGLHSERWESSQDGELRVRMALHTGVTEERGDDYFGPLLNRLARLLAVGHGGQILLTLATAELVRDNLPEGASLRDMGEHRLKDLFRAERVYQLAAPDLPSEFPPLKTLDARPNNLPLQPTPFIGREKEVAEVISQLRNPGVHLVTLTGPGGTGKTRLSLHVAAEMMDDFEGGVYFVPLAAITDPTLVISNLAKTLGVREQGGQPLLEVLREYLRDKRLLLVLDNFEQVLEASTSVAELLTGAPQLKVLATSRAPLHLSAEQQYPVPPLSLPPTDPGHFPSVERLSQYEAVALFISRAQAANTSFEVNNENAPAVAEICFRLDGLPLAIELAAARIKILFPQGILDRLNSRLKLLTGGARDLPARQQTLRNTIEWSYEVLSDDEKELFSRLAVFVRGSALDAAEAVCNTGGDLELDVLDSISSLVDKSLLGQQEGSEGKPRFVMLETIHEFAREKLQESGGREALEKQHAFYFMGLAEQAEPELTGSDQGAWLERLEEEHDNLRAAHDWYLTHKEAEEALRLSGSLTRFWLRRGYFTEGRRQFEIDLALRSPVATLFRAKALHGVGVMSYEQGDHAQAKAYYEEAASMRKQLGDDAGLAASLNNLANVALYQADYQLAATYYEQALGLLRALDNKWGVAMTLGNMGWVGLCHGDYSRALSLYDESLSVRREIGDRWGVANSLGNMAWAAAYQQDYALAQALTEEGMPLFEELGDKDSVSDMLDIQGRVAVAQGNFARAHRLFAESIQVSRELGDKSGIALVLLGYASLAGAQGQIERSAKLFGAADNLRDSTASFQRSYFEPHLAASPALLGEASWDTAWQEGQAMSMEQAIEYALQAS